MRRLPNIKLTEDEVKFIIEKNFMNYGGEAIICKNTSTSLFKIFSNTSDTSHPKPSIMRENKERKINEIFRLQPEHSVLPLSTISLNGNLIGYEMTYDKHECDAYPFLCSPREQIEFLIESKKILEYYKTLGIVYGDVHFGNILQNSQTGELRFCDMDNIQIAGCPIDLYSEELLDYVSTKGLVDEHTDAYMHSLMTLDLFDLDLENFSDDDYKFFFTKKGVKLLKSLKEKEHYQGDYLVKYLRKKFYR